MNNIYPFDMNPCFQYRRFRREAVSLILLKESGGKSINNIDIIFSIC